MKWGEGEKKRKQTKGKRVRKSIRFQEGSILSRRSYRRKAMGNGTAWGRSIRAPYTLS
jgi:hypothetical protein